MSATVSLVTEPDYLSPVNAEMWYNLSSASASQIVDYKYIIDVWKLNQSTGVTSSRLGRFNYDPKDGTSIVLALISNNDFDNSSTSSRSINIDSIEGANPPYIIVNDFIAPISGWNSNIKGISYASVSKISGVDISSISSINCVSNR